MHLQSDESPYFCGCQIGLWCSRDIKRSEEGHAEVLGLSHQIQIAINLQSEFD